MRLIIRTRNKGRHVTTEGVKPYQFENTVDMGAAGYQSVKEMQKELKRRFPNNKGRHVRNRKIKNGLVRIEGPRNHRMTQVITLSQDGCGV